MPSIGERLKNSWNAFLGRDPTIDYLPRITESGMLYGGSTSRPDRIRLSRGNERSIVSSIYNQIAIDVSQVNIKHVRLNEEGQFQETIDSDLNRALNRSANIDQTGRELIKDLTLSMFDEGVVAVVPVVTDKDPETGSYKIYELRIGKITEWFPRHVRVDLYNDISGQREQLVLEKSIVAIIENPFYSVMNEPNSTTQRLLRLLNQIDKINSSNAAGKLDLIVQVPYPIKLQARKEQAEMRRKEIEDQLTNSKYGVAYTDVTEKIVQLNRPLENNLWEQAKDLTEQLYNQLGFSKGIFDGIADEQTMLNYQNRTITPIVSAIAEEMERKWLSLTAVSQGQAIRFFSDPFKLVPIANLAEIADKFTRNEIMTSNEIRSVIGMQPSDDPKADMLINSNLNQSNEAVQEMNGEEPEEDEGVWG